jgi:hypothetical protein
MRRTKLQDRMMVVCGVASVALSASVGAQISEVSRRPIADITQLTFGQLCEDRFVIRNDGANPVTLEYGVEKGSEHTRLTLNGRELVELESKSKEAVELWMDGKLIAKAEKERRSCRDIQGSATVAIAPLDVPTTERNQPQRSAFAGGFGYSPFYDPWGYGYYGGFGFSPFYQGFYGRPIVIVSGRGRRR